MNNTPPPLAPLMRDQRKIDAGHLKLLAVFHFVLAGLTVIGLGFLFLHWLFMHTMFSNPEMAKNMKGTPPPKEFLAMFMWFYLGMGAMIVGMGMAYLASGWCLLKRRARTFSIVIAGISCLGFPFGTVLGIFTLVVLLRESVAELYADPTGQRSSL